MERRTVFSRKRRVEKTTSTAFENADEGGLGLDRATRDLLQDGEQPPDWSLTIVLLARLIVKRLQPVLELDKDHLDKRLADARLREERDKWAQELRTNLIDIRKAAEAVMGRTVSAELIATDGDTPVVTDTLIDQAQHAIRKLGDPSLTVSDAKVDGFDPRPQKWIKTLQPIVEALEELLPKLTTLRRRTDRTVGKKEKAVEQVDYAISHGTAALRALFYLSGLDDIGSRFSVRRRPRSGSGEPQEEEPLVESLPEEDSQEENAQDDEPQGEDSEPQETEMPASEAGEEAEPGGSPPPGTGPVGDCRAPVS